MPAVEHKSALPDSDKFKFMALDEDGYDVPADWFVIFIYFQFVTPQPISSD